MDLKEMWMRSCTINFTDPPLLPREVMEQKNLKEICQYLNVANVVKLCVYTLEWPVVPIDLAMAIERGKDEERVMAWGLVVRDAVFDSFPWLRMGFSKYQFTTMLPNKPELCGTYTDKQKLMLHDYGMDMAQAYALLVPDITCDGPPELREWCYTIYLRYNRKPEAVPDQNMYEHV